VAADPPPDHRRHDWLSRVYWDLWLVGGFAFLTAIVALTPSTAGSSSRIALALAHVLFVPGYTLVSVLFPEDSTVDGLERVTLAFGLSIALTAFLALGLNFTPLGIRLGPIVATHTVFVLGGLIVAAIRRTNLLYSNHSRPEATPFVVPFDGVLGLARDIYAELTGEAAESRLEYALTILLVLSIIFAGVSAAWTLSTPRTGEQFTEFYILTEQETPLSNETELVAGGYPTDLTTEESANVVLTVENNEFEQVTYRVVIRLRAPATNRTGRIQAIDDIRTEHNETDAAIYRHRTAA